MHFVVVLKFDSRFESFSARTLQNERLLALMSQIMCRCTVACNLRQMLTNFQNSVAARLASKLNHTLSVMLHYFVEYLMSF